MDKWAKAGNFPVKVLIFENGGNIVSLLGNIFCRARRAPSSRSVLIYN
jgi:hypothetical protein